MSAPYVSDIPKEYNTLKKDFIVLKKELDCTKQELYESKRNIQLLEALQNDYQSELELLQSKFDVEKNSLQEKICQLEEYNSCLKLKFNDQINSLEINLLKYEEENLFLKDEIEILKKSPSSDSDADIIHKLNDEIFNLKSENLMILESSEEIKVFLASLQKQNSVLEEIISQNKQEIDELKNSLKFKREELMEANEIIDKLNEEFISIKNELETQKNQTLEKYSQGNSLFAEVDDRRVYLQKSINNMKQDYMAIKQERAKHIREIHHLKIENRTLLEKWKTDMNEKDDDHYSELVAVKGRVELLENLLESYKKDLNEKQTPSTSNTYEGFEFYTAMIKNKNKEIEDLRQQLSTISLTEIILSRALNKANEEKRKWKLEAAIKSNEVELLRVDDVCNTKTLKCLEETEDEKPTYSLQKCIQNYNFTKLNEIECISINKNISLDSNSSKKSEHSKLHKNIYSNISEKQKLFENKIEEKENSIHSDPVLVKHDMTECRQNLDQNPTENTSVVILDDTSDENTLPKEINIEKEEELANNEENVISRDKEDYLFSDISSDNTNEIESRELNKKVTFSVNTISPKKTALRKCKKVIVSRPVIINRFNN